MSQSEPTFYKQLNQMYLRAPINQSFKPELTISKGSSKLTVAINKNHFHSAHYVHGAVIFKLLDDSAFFAAQSLEHTYFVVTSSFTSYFIRPVNKGHLIATGTIISQTKTRIIAESIVKDENEKIIAKGSGVFANSRTPLDSLLT